MKSSAILLVALCMVNTLAISKLRKNTIKKDCPEMKHCYATLFQNGDFTGWFADYPKGSYGANAFFAQGARNDESNSLKVFGPSNCCVALYQTGDFNGWRAFFGPGSYNA